MLLTPRNLWRLRAGKSKLANLNDLPESLTFSYSREFRAHRTLCAAVAMRRNSQCQRCVPHFRARLVTQACCFLIRFSPSPVSYIASTQYTNRPCPASASISRAANAASCYPLAEA
jgi:hypothetical protein